MIVGVWAVVELRLVDSVLSISGRGSVRLPGSCP